jgi:tellurite methyltransferase
MEREIGAFFQDEAGDWVAQLSCGHCRHVRHNPPHNDRPWVLSESERASRCGTSIECLACERRELPAHYVASNRTPTFNATTIPDGLRASHSTKAGVWAKIHVLSGQLRYRVHAPFGDSVLLDVDSEGVILPEVLHEVEAQGEVAFFVEFWRDEARVGRSRKGG